MNTTELFNMKAEKTPKRAKALCRICGNLIDDDIRVRLMIGTTYGFVTHDNCIRNMYNAIILRKI
jgi:hypothetical protein